MAVRVVEAGRQVAVLCPTTVLAFQHLRTFRERFAEFDVRIDMLSRFVDAAETRAVKTRVAEGTAHIVVGTTALLGRGALAGEIVGVRGVETRHAYALRSARCWSSARAISSRVFLTRE